MTTSTSTSSSSSSYQMDPHERQLILTLPGNSKCMECHQRNPEWASLSLGIVLCLECSGKHRGLGTHLSFVRSMTMDSWTPLQIQKMKCGGNEQCRMFLTNHGIIPTTTTTTTTISIKEKYDNPVAEWYRQIVTARSLGQPEPTEMPLPTIPKQTSTRSMQGFGSNGPFPKNNNNKDKELQKQKRKQKIVIGVAVSSVVALAAWMTVSKKGGSSSGGAGNGKLYRRSPKSRP